jgi:peptidoglycan/LPS O-acetylase OafA/YrhL
MTTSHIGAGRLPYNPAFDGLRALAALGVLAYHCKVPGFSGVHALATGSSRVGHRIYRRLAVEVLLAW